jgi:hypothetical protein
MDGEPGRADVWLKGQRIPEGVIIRGVDRVFARTWGELGVAVHPNLQAIRSQIESTESAVIGMHGARRSRQLHRLVADFGVLVVQETQFMAQHVPQVLQGDVNLEALNAYFDAVDEYADEVRGQAS